MQEPSIMEDSVLKPQINETEKLGNNKPCRSDYSSDEEFEVE